MKKMLLVILIISTVAQARQNGDKIAHALAGGIIYGVCVLTGGAMRQQGYDTILTKEFCLIPVIAAGIGKEIYDSQHPENHTADWKDAAATMVIPIGTVVLYRW